MNFKRIIFPLTVFFVFSVFTSPLLASSRSSRIKRMLEQFRNKRKHRTVKISRQKSNLPDMSHAAYKDKNFVRVDKSMLLKDIYNKNYKYIIGPGDKLSLNVFGVPEFSKSYLVGPDGSITLPIFGRIKVEGKTQEEIASIVKRKMSSMYNNPKVVVSVTDYTNNFVYVLGRVMSPGKYNFKGRPTLMELIALSGGLKPITEVQGQIGSSGSGFLSKYGHATVIRGKEQMIEVDLDKLLNEGAVDLNIPLRCRDIVYIPYTNKRVYVLGMVNSPGLKPYEPGMTLLQALSVGGNTSERANLKRVRVIRGNSECPQIYNVNVANALNRRHYKPFVLRDGDIVYVPKRGSDKFSYTISWISSAMSTVLLGDSFVKLFERK